MRQAYRVRAVRDGKWWALSTDGVPGAFSQVRLLNQAEPMIRDAIAQVLEVPEDSFDLEVVPQLEDSAREAMAELARAKAQYLAAMDAVIAQQQAVIEKLRTLSMRDIGAIMGVSHQRVNQLMKRMGEIPLGSEQLKDVAEHSEL
jgi:DNA-directed RNA polymerase specialized sigma24 family protein